MCSRRSGGGEGWAHAARVVSGEQSHANRVRHIRGNAVASPEITGDSASCTSPISADPAGTVTRWIPKLKQGDPEAQAWLLARYYQHVVRVADAQMGTVPRRAADEEDVASEVFRQFLDRAQINGFRRLEDRTDLESILMMLTQRRATDACRTATARRKFELGESAFGGAKGHPAKRVLDAQPAAEAGHSEDSVTRELAENIRRLFCSIECDELKLDQIALLACKDSRRTKSPTRLAS